MSGKIVLRFVDKQAPYNAGEEAGFDPMQARRLVELGKAVYLTPPPGLDARGRSLAAAKPVHLGGGWYEVAGRKVKGKKKAEELAKAGS